MEDWEWEIEREMTKEEKARMKKRMDRIRRLTPSQHHPAIRRLKILKALRKYREEVIEPAKDEHEYPSDYDDEDKLEMMINLLGYEVIKPI